MKVKCIDNSNSSGAPVDLTVGRSYEVLNDNDDCIRVRDDRGVRFGYFSWRFSSLNAHVHAELIHAWADGAIIQHHFVGSGRWADTCDNNPSWLSGEQYRVKPDEVIELERQIQAAQTGIDVAHNLLEDLTKQLEKANA